MRSSSALLGVAAVLCAGVEAGPAVTPSALAEDDVCRTTAGAQDGRCALAALQRSSRQGESLHRPGAGFKATTAAPEWVLPSDKMSDMWMMPKNEEVRNLLNEMAVWFTPFALEIPFCQTYTSYLWPGMAFFAKETTRRFAMVDKDDEANLRRVRVFARQASFLVNVFDFDPRPGAIWADDVKAFFHEVAASDSLDMPKLPDVMLRLSNTDKSWASSIGMWWYENMMCDINWWRREMLGSKPDTSEVCWDEVKHPGYAYSPFWSFQQGEPAWPADFDSTHYPEYLQCQDYMPNETFWDHLCPFGGHMEEGTWNASWGKGIPSAAGRAEVLECQAKMGPAQYYTMSPVTIAYAFQGKIGLGRLINDGMPTILNFTEAWDAHMVDPESFRKAIQQAWHLEELEEIKAQYYLTDFDPWDRSMADVETFEEFFDRLVEYVAEGALVSNRGINEAVKKGELPPNPNPVEVYYHRSLRDEKDGGQSGNAQARA